MRELLIKQKNHLVKRVHLNKKYVTIGRDRFCDVTLRDKTVSKRHAIILFDGENSYLEDMGSTNSTQVNSNIVEQHKLLNDDVISIGRFQIHYRQGSVTS